MRESISVLSSCFKRAGIDSGTTLTVGEVLIREVDNDPDGLPYTDRYSYQTVTIVEFGDGQEIAAGRFFLVQEVLGQYGNEEDVFTGSRIEVRRPH